MYTNVLSVSKLSPLTIHHGNVMEMSLGPHTICLIERLFTLTFVCRPTSYLMNIDASLTPLPLFVLLMVIEQSLMNDNACRFITVQIVNSNVQIISWKVEIGLQTKVHTSTVKGTRIDYISLVTQPYLFP